MPGYLASLGANPDKRRSLSGALLQKFQQECRDLLRLLLLHPVASAIDQVTAEHARARASLHALEGAGELIGAPVALAGDEQRRHVDGAAGEKLELGGEHVLGAAAIPLQAALKAGAL